MERFIVCCHVYGQRLSGQIWKDAFGINEAAAKMLFEIQNPHLKIDSIYATNKETLVK